MVLSSAGLLLYVFEQVRGRVVFGVIIYTIIVVWLLFLWLYVRPRSFKKQTAKLNETMKRLEKIENQINDNEQE